MKKMELTDFLKEGKIWKEPFAKRLSPQFMAKARNNLETMGILHDLMFNSKAKEILKVQAHYSSNEWVAITGYYSMYLAAQSVLAKAGYRSKSHEGTIIAMEELFVKKEKLEPNYLRMLKSAQLEEKFVSDLRIAKERRQIAQYGVTKETSDDLAERIREDAPKFVNRLDILLEQMSLASS